MSGNFHSLPQSALNSDKMRVLVAVLMLALSLGYSFRVEDVFDIFEAGLNILPQNEIIMDQKIGVKERKCVNLGSLQSLNYASFFFFSKRVIFFRSVGRILSLLRTLWTRTDRATASVTTSRPCSESISSPVSSQICC